MSSSSFIPLSLFNVLAQMNTCYVLKSLNDQTVVQCCGYLAVSFLLLLLTLGLDAELIQHSLVVLQNQ